MVRARRRARNRVPARPTSAAWIALAGVGLGAAVHAQEPSRLVTITPSVAVSATASDNSKLSATDRQSEVITQVSPAVRAEIRSGRLQGALDYTLTGAVYSRHSEENEVRQALNARASAELVDNHLYVNGNASISRRAISAFGTQEAEAGLINGNATEVANISINPSLRGRIGGVVNYEAQVGREITRAKDTNNSDSDSTSASMRLSGGSGLLGWALDGMRFVNEYRLGRKTTNDRAFATISAQPDIEVRVALRGGREASDVTTPERTFNNTYGASVAWLPTERTTISLDADHRYYGNSHALVLQHRMARSVFRFTDSRSASTDNSPAPFTAYDLYFTQLKSSIPDPVQRDAFVRAYLAALGIDPRTGVPGGFLTSALTVARRQDLSWSMSGVRTTYTLLAFSSETRRIGAVPIGNSADDLGKVDLVRQLGYTFAVGHRLTPDSSLNLGLTRLKTMAADTLPGNDLRSIDLTWTGRLGPRASVSLGGRHSESESSAAPYTESAVTATLSLTF